MSTTTTRILSSPLVTVPNLKNLLKSNDLFNKSFRVLDANVGSKPKDQYNAGHIENAVYFDTMHCVKPNEWYPRNIPEKQCFQDYAGSLGISNKHHLIVYDRSPYGFYAAPRVYWLFRYFGHDKISVLNGGFNRWNFENGVLTKKSTQFKPEKFVINENKSLIRNFDEIIDNIKSNKELVVDVRAREQYNGSLEFQVAGQSGHIKGSKNLPFSEFFDEASGSIKNEKQLNELIKKVVSNKNDPIIASCLTGMTASTLFFVLDLLGYKNSSLYYGSWTEFSQRASKDQCEISVKEK